MKEKKIFSETLLENEDTIRWWHQLLKKQTKSFKLKAVDSTPVFPIVTFFCSFFFDIFAGFTFQPLQGHSRPASGQPSVSDHLTRRPVIGAPWPCPLLSTVPLTGEIPSQTHQPPSLSTGFSLNVSDCFCFDWRPKNCWKTSMRCANFSGTPDAHRFLGLTDLNSPCLYKERLQEMNKNQGSKCHLSNGSISTQTG